MNRFLSSHWPAAICRRGLNLLIVAAILFGGLPTFQPQPAAAQTEAPEAAALNALSLAGTNGYVRVPNSSELNNLTSITIEAWVYRNTTLRAETIVGNGWTTSYWLGTTPSGKLRFIAHGDGDFVDSNSTLTAEKWTHVAVTYNGSQRNFYINGVLDKTTNVSPGAITPNTDPLGIGFDADPFTGNYFDGMIDEVRIWNAVRTPAQIQAGMFQPFNGPYPTSLIGYWQLDGNASDETGDHDGSVQGGLGSSSWTNDGAIPHDIRIPQIATTPTLDGQCGDYANAMIVTVEGVEISLQHTPTDLWACFHFYTNNAGYTRASLLLDPNHDRLDPAQLDDLRMDVRDDDTLGSYAGDDIGHWVITDTFSTEWDGEWHVTGGEFPYHTAEFRVAQSLLGEWGSVIGLALDPYIPGPLFRDNAGMWPALSVNTLPSTWSNATLAGTGPARTFSGSVQYQPKNLTYDPSGIYGAKVELYGYDTSGSEALVATTSSSTSGSFSLTTDDDFPRHRLELVQYPQGYIPSEAEAPAPGNVLDSRSIDYGTAGGGTYPDNLFTLGDPVPGNLAAPYGPVFLIVAPQEVIDADALEEFRNFKIGQGYAISIRSVEYADANYPGATRLMKIRALEQDYLATYGNRFQFVMLVGTGDTIPYAKVTPYATGAVPICPSDDPKNYKYSDWLYVDLTSNSNSNGNGCALDGPLGDPAKRVNGYTPDSFAFDPTIALGRIPFDDPNTVREVLHNSIGFEKQSESYKLKALNSMSLVALKGYFDGEICADNWGDHCVPPSSNTERSYDTAVLSEEMKDDFLDVNGFNTTELYENEEAIAGGIGVSSPDLTLANVRDALDDGRFGLAVMSGHGNSTGVYRNFWSSDKNNNGVVDVSDSSSTTELSETQFFDINGVLNQVDPDGTRGSVFVLLACSNASPTNASNLAATILSDGHGPASVAALSVVTVGSWLNENGTNVESIGYYVNKRLVSRGYRLGESVWWTLADLVKKGKSGSGGVAYDLYGDPTLSFYGNPNGQATLAPWPMGRRTPSGDSYLSLPGPTVPKKLWEYTTGMHTADTYGPTPLVSANGEVIVAAETYVDVLRNGVLFQRLNLDGYVFGSPALSADGTIYVMDQDANMYAFPYKRLSYGNTTWVLDERHRRWKLDLGENPQASPTIGSDGYILAGVGGPTASDPRLWLVRPDGELFSSWALDHNPVYYVTTDASRVIYVTTSGQDGYIYRFTQFCDTFVNPDVCPYNSWVEATIPDGFNTPPLLAYGSVYAGDVDDTLYKFNKDTLAVEATFVADSAIQMGPIATPSGDILIITGQGVMYSLTKNLATVRWQKNLGYTSIHGVPAASTNAIYMAFDGYLRAYNPSSGALLWKRSLGGEISYASVSVGYGREVYVQGVTGDVLAFGEGWAARPARIIATPGLYPASSRQLMTIEIQQTVELTPALTLAPEASDAINATIVAMQLQRSEDGGPWEDVALLDPGTTSFTDTNIAPNVSYQYRVQNLMSDGTNSDYETTLDVIQSLPDIAGVPVLDSVTAISSNAIEVAWTPYAGSVVENFIVGRSLGGPYTPIITVTSETTSIIDTSLSPGVTASYRVMAINNSGPSDSSSPLNATTFTQNLAAPQNFQSAKTGSATITLTWTPGPAGTTAVIEIITFGEYEYSVLTTLAADAGTFSFTNGEPGAYDFRIKYVQGADESAYAYDGTSVVISEPMTLYLPLIGR